MSVIRKAIPTEYKGIRFDSKSEAIFARCLDLAGIKWHQSHPIRHDGHDWDFAIIVDDLDFELLGDEPLRTTEGDLCEGTTHITLECERLILVELKPRCPSETYVHNLACKKSDNISRILIYGNPFEPPIQNHWYGPLVYQFFEIRKGVGSHLPLNLCSCDGLNTRLGAIEVFISQAKAFRFDLA